MSQVATRVHDFTVTLSGISELTAEVADRLYEAGCDDASPYSEGPTVHLTFHREAESIGDAVGSAMKDVGRAGYRVAHVEIEATED